MLVPSVGITCSGSSGTGPGSTPGDGIQFRSQPKGELMKNIKTLLLALVAAASLCGFVATGARADIVREGNTFNANPAYCSCWSTVDGYVFNGIPYSPFVRDVFLGLPSDTPVVTDMMDALRADPNYTPLPPVTSVGGEVTIGGTVEDTVAPTPTRTASRRRSGKLAVGG